MMTIEDVRKSINDDPKHWRQYLFSFVDEFRHYKKVSQISQFNASDDKYDHLLASVTEQLCDEMNIKHPRWTDRIGRLQDPWFLSEIRTGRIIALIESPAMYRRRNIFVARDFLFRV